MGIVFGRTGSAEPAFTTLHSFSGNVTHSLPISIRSVPSYLIAKVPMHDLQTPGSKGNSAFTVLAKYIGVFGQVSHSYHLSQSCSILVCETNLLIASHHSTITASEQREATTLNDSPCVEYRG